MRHGLTLRGLWAALLLACALIAPLHAEDDNEWWLQIEPHAEPASAPPANAKTEPTADDEPQGNRQVEVVLQGLPEYLQEDVLNSLTVQRQRKSPYLDDLLVGNLAQRAEREAAEAMEASGFYRAKVSAQLQTTDSGWRLTLDFVPGPIVRIVSTDIVLLGEAKDNPRVADEVRNFPLIVNAPLVHMPYERFKTAWLQRAHDQGYLDARFTRHEILVNPIDDTAQVFLTLDSGQRYRFGRTRFDQQGDMIFEQRLLEGFVPWKEGEPYRVRPLLDLQRALAESNYFERMEVDPVPDRASHTVNVQVGLSARKQTRYAFGLGYGTDTGARASAEMERRFLNPRGDRFYGRLAVSERDIQVDAELRRPWLEAWQVGGAAFGGNPRTDFWALGLTTRRELLDDVTTNPLALRLAANDIKGEWKRQARLLMLYEKDEIDQSPNLYGHLFMPGVALFYRPRIRGREALLQWDVDVQSTLGTLASSTSLSQFRLNGTWNQPVGAADQLVLRGSVGASWSRDFAKVPISQRFFTGGDMSVRGYSYKSLGPTNAQGKVVGGENLLVVSAEYQWMFKNPFGVAFFVDSGNAFNGGDVSLKTGAGIGGLWRSPVGMLGVYLAHGFENQDDPVLLHFSLGVEF